MEIIEEGQNQPKIGPKQIKFEEIENWEMDRLSVLPDCLLAEILSRLDCTVDAFCTCILSKRWKHLWTWVHTIIFEDEYFDYPRSEFFTFVDKTLTQRPQLKLKKFEVHATYNTKFESQVDNWIRYVMGCNVEELILKLYTNYDCHLDQFFDTRACFTDLTLEGFILNPTGAITWKNLRSLSIFHGKLDEDLIENILSSSPVLETLELNYCYGFKLLDITSTSVKNLVFSGPYDPDIFRLEFVEVIEINAPNISSLTIQDELGLLKLSLLNVTSLIQANLDYMNHEKMSKKLEEEMLKGFILKLCNVKELKIGKCCSKVLSRLVAKGFDLLSNIKFLDGAYELMQQGDSSESESESESDEDV